MTSWAVNQSLSYTIIILLESESLFSIPSYFSRTNGGAPDLLPPPPPPRSSTSSSSSASAARATNAIWETALTRLETQQRPSASRGADGEEEKEGSEKGKKEEEDKEKEDKED